ncbi:hypothetical protein [Chitinivorax sp. B]|uniref:hypothetical protein n=1 Tax=Chitinivorax sp. B TaxID=2502235 RepID=UPI0010F753B2|nr:hypothetical protein [Chitinivorax sp. B]
MKRIICTLQHCLLVSALLVMPMVAIAGPDASEPATLTMRFQASMPPAPNDFQLQFVGYQDTRCPADVVCAVAGEAQAIFWLTGARIRPQLIALHWNGGEPNWRLAVRAAGREFLLRSLEPRPLINGTVNPADYTAVVDVRSYHAQSKAVRK